jgi:hypothetical protein
VLLGGAIEVGAGVDPVAVAVLLDVGAAIAEAPQAVAAAFKDAKPDLKKKADGAIAALKDKKWDAALLMLQDLSVLPGLTPQQREAATGSMLAANQELKAAAEKGDAQASELMNARRMSK